MLAIAVFVGIGFSALLNTGRGPAGPPSATAPPAAGADPSQLTATAAAAQVAQLQATLTAIGAGGASTATAPLAAPSATPLPPTAPVPPTETVPPPSATPLPPTPILPTETVPPSETPVPPTPNPAPQPAAPGCDSPPPAVDTPPPATDTAQQVTLNDLAFQGGYRYRPPKTYQGQTAVWIYGQGSCFASMTAPFQLAPQPAGLAHLTIVGMDSEDPDKAPIRILVNDQEIYNGADPLPNTAYIGPAAGSDSWGTASWTFAASVLHPGDNTLTIENHSPSDRVIPWMMVHSAQIQWDAEH
jgi:hypothetical protein